MPRLTHSVSIAAGFLALAVLSSCKTTSPDSNNQAAFIAGQRAALQEMTEGRRTSIRFLGPVENPNVPWSEHLGLIEAIVAAGYREQDSPGTIIINRKGQRILVPAQFLLQGKDIPLEAGDTVEIYP